MNEEVTVDETTYILSDGSVYVQKIGLKEWVAYWENDSTADLPWDELIEAWGNP